MNNKDKIILDLCCGEDKNWSNPYELAGYTAIGIDIIFGIDVRLHNPPPNIYGILAAPPCTHLSGSGARWWKEKGKEKLLEALSIVDACMRIILISNPVFWCLENPVGRLIHYLGKPKMYFNPCDYGDSYTKKTALWGKFNMPLKTPVTPIRVCKQGSWVQKLGGKSETTKKIRSITPPGFAKAFFEANQ